jgi:hypothetical protein
MSFKLGNVKHKILLKSVFIYSNLFYPCPKNPETESILCKVMGLTN